MKVQNPETLARVKARLNKLLQLDVYYDFILMTYDDFVQKYNSYGFGFINFYEIEFSNYLNITNIIQDFHFRGEDVYLLPIDREKSVHAIEVKDLNNYLSEQGINADNFVVLDKDMKWALVKNKQNKLIGIGSFSRKRIKKNWSLRFVDKRIIAETESVRT